jgi:S-DNA-T family DNA segregation ATPase FtsK/SpoIIIE
VVRLRPILESEEFNKINSPLAIALGRNVSGQPVVADLSRMPHLLIAGTTGSGKSVCIAALTACLVMNNTPEDLRLVMIDPKMVELVRFGLHLCGQVETDLEHHPGVLRWTLLRWTAVTGCGPHSRTGLL